MQFFGCEFQQINDFSGILGIQIAGRLVRQNDTGLIDQRPSNGHPLLLTAGKLRGQMSFALVQIQNANDFFQIGF